MLKPRAMQNLGLALHELATNSAKYGALSAPEGHVEISWRSTKRGGGPVLHLIWREVGGPQVVPPTRKGFGSMLLNRIVGVELNGRSIMKYRRAGVVWQTEIGKAHFTQPGMPQSESLDTTFGREAQSRQQYDQSIKQSSRMVG
ncbi:MAG: hypothetical protein ACREEP_00465 [Dongiaceae bacterium]